MTDASRKDKDDSSSPESRTATQAWVSQRASVCSESDAAILTPATTESDAGPYDGTGTGTGTETETETGRRVEDDIGTKARRMYAREQRLFQTRRVSALEHRSRKRRQQKQQQQDQDRGEERIQADANEDRRANSYRPMPLQHVQPHWMDEWSLLVGIVSWIIVFTVSWGMKSTFTAIKDDLFYGIRAPNATSVAAETRTETVTITKTHHSQIQPVTTTVTATTTTTTTTTTQAIATVTQTSVVNHWADHRGTIPWQGNSYRIREKGSGRVLCRTSEGGVRLCRAPPEAQTNTRQNIAGHASRSSASDSVWFCVETNGWLGFHHVPSGGYLGKDFHGGIKADAKSHRAWEMMTARKRPEGGWHIMMEAWGKLEMMVVDDDGTLVLRRHGTTVWEFEMV